MSDSSALLPHPRSAEPPVHEACVHEAAHAVVDRAFGRKVVAVWVCGEAGRVETAEVPEPATAAGWVGESWAGLCSAVAGDLGELLDAEWTQTQDLLLDGAAAGTAADGWPTPAERRRRRESDEALWRALSRGRTAELDFPSGEFGEFLRYAVAATGRVLPVTARLWCKTRRASVSPAGSVASPWSAAGEVATLDAEQSLRFALDVWAAGAACKPFAEAWPADVIDPDGLFPVLHVIRYAEVEAERLLKRYWAGVRAVADNLFTRADHRLTGVELDDILRQHGGPPSPLTP